MVFIGRGTRMIIILPVAIVAPASAGMRNSEQLNEQYGTDRLQEHRS
jgi:hypothetical protein